MEMSGADPSKWYGDTSAKKANNMFGWLTDTDITQTEHKITQRFYKHREGKKDSEVVCCENK